MTTTAMVPSHGSHYGTIYGLIIKFYGVLKLRLDREHLNLLVLRGENIRSLVSNEIFEEIFCLVLLFQAIRYIYKILDLNFPYLILILDF